MNINDMTTQELRTARNVALKEYIAIRRAGGVSKSKKARLVTLALALYHREQTANE